jgi:hypothetical protein
MRRLLLALLALSWAHVDLATGLEVQGLLRLGAPSPVQAGHPTAHPHLRVPASKFYVLVVARDVPTMCTFEDCGPEGAEVERLGGWITGDDQAETIHTVGLNENLVRSGNQSIIVVSNASGRIVGIYPGRKMIDLPRILRNHRELWDNGLSKRRAAQ